MHDFPMSYQLTHSAFSVFSGILALCRHLRFRKQKSHFLPFRVALIIARMIKHAVLTGPPGVGKTTLVQKICKALQDRGVKTAGFVTQELREGGQRTGFQIITLDGKIGLLSSIKSKSRSRVGQYGVEVEEFEQIALPVLEQGLTEKCVLVIDEVGKMEMFSEKFRDAVTKAFNAPGTSILATIPIPKGKAIPLVENIRHHANAKLFQIDRSNRDTIINEIIQVLVPTK